MENQTEKEEGGITLSFIFRTIFSQKWLALIIAAVITVTGTAALYFLGKRGEDYSIAYKMTFPDSSNSPAVFTYPDNTTFNFNAIISLENMNNVKATRPEEYGDINVEKMVKKGDIQVIRESTETVVGSKIYEATYQLSAKARYFSSNEIARNFLQDLINIPVAHMLQMKLNYDLTLTASKQAITYSTQIEKLKEQAQHVSSRYDELIKIFGNNYVIDGKALGAYREDVRVYISNDPFTGLLTDIKTNYYVKSEEAYAKHLSDLIYWNEQLEKEEAILNVLQTEQQMGVNNGDGTQITIGDNPTLANQKRTVENIKITIRDLEHYTSSESKIGPAAAEFDAKVIKVEGEIESFTRTLETVAATAYGEFTEANFLNVNVITVENNRGIVKSGLISLVAGVVIALIVAFVVGWSKINKLLFKPKAASVEATDTPQPEAVETAEAPSQPKADETAEAPSQPEIPEK